MPVSVVNGIRIYSESQGEGAPMVLVHGSWGDHRNWDLVVPGLARTFRTLTYDRRGHSQSERLAVREGPSACATTHVQWRRACAAPDPSRGLCKHRRRIH